MAWLSALFTKQMVPVILIAALLAVAGIATRAAVGKVSDMIDDRIATAKAERDAHWRAEVAEANAALSGAIAELARQAMRADGEIRAAEAAAHDQLKQMEVDNAALPDGDGCGVSARRLQLLPR
ncbi:hypothetical protein Mame_02601 [Martelella mediterranea DSM 17316]|uniref:Uncharacterized protein n=1 Tax=Martelella mediterranea DSM 17316 TaxID=1122214 RepID=A0A1U9Z2K3_9HYPH|nr:hypothetical protein Mame_02601 [Martelella mediterranea DSM 17316]